MSRRWARRALLAACLLGAAACETRTLAIRPAVFDADVEPVLAARCAPCHTGDAPEAGYRVGTYLDVIGCVAATGVPAILPDDDSAPILAVLARDDHAGALSEAERDLLSDWVAIGAPARVGAAHLPGFVDPRSPDFHGARLRASRWAELLDPTGPGACARCHDGAVPGERETTTAPGATDCTSCHTEPGGPLACSTCHGQPGRAQPPRDPCFHPDESASAGAHDAHVLAGLDCAVCHGARDTTLDVGPHGDGVVDLAFDVARAGPDASFDLASRRCAVACHDRGGAMPQPRWDAAATLGCGDCHGAPPRDHYPGPCTSCHAEADADGTALRPGPLHGNGRVDLGNGDGSCGACHGSAMDPWPLDGRHQAHRSAELTDNITCEACHRVPADVSDPSHLDATVGAEITFGPLASSRGQVPDYDTGACSVACHGLGLSGGFETTPRWDDDTGNAGRCGACHGVPPAPPHATSTTCAASACHGSEVSHGPAGPAITDVGRAVHVDGFIDFAGGI